MNYHVTAADLDRALTIVDITICLIDMVLVIMLYRQRTSVAPRPSTLALAFRRVRAARHTRRVSHRGHMTKHKV